MIKRRKINIPISALIYIPTVGVKCTLAFSNVPRHPIMDVLNYLNLNSMIIDFIQKTILSGDDQPINIIYLFIL